MYAFQSHKHLTTSLFAVRDASIGRHENDSDSSEADYKAHEREQENGHETGNGTDDESDEQEQDFDSDSAMLAALLKIQNGKFPQPKSTVESIKRRSRGISAESQTSSPDPSPSIRGASGNAESDEHANQSREGTSRRSGKALIISPFTDHILDV